MMKSALEAKRMAQQLYSHKEEVERNGVHAVINALNQALFSSAMIQPWFGSQAIPLSVHEVGSCASDHMQFVSRIFLKLIAYNPARIR